MLSEIDKQQIRELLKMTHEDILVFNLEYIYQKVEDLLNKEIFSDYLNYLKENPDIGNNLDLGNNDRNDFENNLMTQVCGSLFYENIDDENYDSIIDNIRLWIRHRVDNLGAALS